MTKQQDKYALRVANNLCGACGRNPLPELPFKRCTTCRTYAREQYRRKPERAKAWVREYNRMNPLKHLLLVIKSRARIAGLEFDIEFDDIIIPEFCPLLGIKLTPPYAQKGYQATSYSIDRIDPTKGYVKGNIMVISRKANTMKSDASREELLDFAANVIRLFKD